VTGTTNRPRNEEARTLQGTKHEASERLKKEKKDRKTSTNIDNPHRGFIDWLGRKHG